MPYLSRPGCDLYYETHGAGPPVVFAHGLGGNHLTWWQQVPRFAARFTCVTFAFRGFGRSPEPPGGPGLAAFADDLLALIDHLGFERVALVAQSMGGWPSTRIAADHPGRVAGLVLANTTGALTHPELDAIFAEHHARPLVIPPGVHPAAGARLLREQPAMHYLYGQLDAMSPAIDKRTLRRALLHETRDLPVERLRVPLLAVAGEEDLEIPAAAIAWVAAHVPGAALHVEPSAGHSVYWERPDAFNAAVERFLADRVYPGP